MSPPPKADQTSKELPAGLAIFLLGLGEVACVALLLIAL